MQEYEEHRVLKMAMITEKKLNDYLSLWETEINLNINKRAVEDQTKKHRDVLKY